MTESLSMTTRTSHFSASDEVDHSNCHTEGSSSNRPIKRCNEYLSSWSLAVVIFSLYLATLLVALDVNIIGTAVPKIAAVFNSLDDVAWYGSAYLLTLTAFQPIMGFVYKYFNTKSSYLISIAIFEVGSILCAAAPNSNTFIVGRAIAGLGAAGIFQGNLTIISCIVSLEKRPMLMGIVISVFGVSVCIGPVMGGVFTDKVNWRWCFWINLPVGGVALCLVIILLKIKATHNERRDLSFIEKLKQLDVFGAVLFLSAVCCLILALQWGGQRFPWSSSKVIGLFVGFGLLALAFNFVQWRIGERAIIPIPILRQRSIFVGSLFLFFSGMLNFIYAYFIPFYFQAVQGVSATTSGVRLIPLMLSQITVVVVTGAIVTRWGYYVPYMVLGQTVSVVGAGLLTRIGLGTPTREWAAYLVLTGMGLGMSQVLPYTAVQVVLSEADVPTGNAIAVFANHLGGVIALPISQALLINTLKQRLAQYTTAVSPEVLAQTGPYDLQVLAHGDPNVLKALRQVYTIGLQRIYILALAAGCVAALCTFGMERKNVKEEEVRRREDLSSGFELEKDVGAKESEIASKES